MTKTKLLMAGLVASIGLSVSPLSAEETLVGAAAGFDELTSIQRDALVIQGDAAIVYHSTLGWQFTNDGGESYLPLADAVAAGFLSNDIGDYLEDESPTTSADFVMVYDSSEGKWVKTLIEDLGMGGGSSLTSDDSVEITSDVITLVNDDAAPGNSTYYGTNGSGTKGFFSLPSGVTFEGLTDTESYTGNALKLLRVNATTDGIEYITPDYAEDGLTLTAGDGLTGGGDLSANRTFTVSAKNSIEIDSDSLQLDGDAASPGNTKLYGTDGSGVKGWYDQPAGGSFDIAGLSPMTLEVDGDADVIPIHDDNTANDRSMTFAQFFGRGMYGIDTDADGLVIPADSYVSLATSTTADGVKLNLKNVYRSIVSGTGATEIPSVADNDRIAIVDVSSGLVYYIEKSDLAGSDSSTSIAKIQHTTATGVNGGGTTASAWTKLATWTEVEDADSIVSISSGSMTLASGHFYEIRASHQFVLSNNTQLRVNNTTDSEVHPGVNIYTSNANHADIAEATAIIDATGGAVTLDVEYYLTNATASNGLGDAIGHGDPEVFGEIIITTLD